MTLLDLIRRKEGKAEKLAGSNDREISSEKGDGRGTRRRNNEFLFAGSERENRVSN